MINPEEFGKAGPPNLKKPPGLFITDFDGTLLRSDRTVADNDLVALKNLGRRGFVRSIATGRSFHSFKTVAGADLPIDYVIFSTGAGVCHHPTRRIIRKTALEAAEVQRAMQVLLAAGLDFMVHRPIPDNHVFAYWGSPGDNPDFQKRLALYRPYAFPLDQSGDGFGPATQLLAVVPAPQSKRALGIVRRELPDLSIIQTTSPLDGQSTWIEIFPPSVSKSLTAAWLTAALGIRPRDVLAVGNDFNDLDLLEWSGTSFVVSNAPEALKRRFPAVASHDEAGVAEAVARWLATPSQ
ncbi:MAG: HAD hydrolase family protein [Desulfobacterales bacterium]|nr:MAG: HAD hydrolase family protein [Desulfobacterales bacterium]